MSSGRSRGGAARRRLLAAIAALGLGACEATGPGLQPVASGLLGESWRGRLAVGDELLVADAATGERCRAVKVGERGALVRLEDLEIRCGSFEEPASRLRRFPIRASEDLTPFLERRELALWDAPASECGPLERRSVGAEVEVLVRRCTDGDGWPMLTLAARSAGDGQAIVGAVLPPLVPIVERLLVPGADPALLRRAAARLAAADAGLAEKARVLYEALLAPLAPALAGRDHLLLVPDGPLQALPLGVLVVGEGPGPRFLAAERALSVLPAVASLPLGRYRVIAFATHGLLPGELRCASEPALVLTPPARPGPDDDGLLGASEIAVFALHAEWVSLSACNTAVGGPGGGEALGGLAGAFLRAGARRVLASHWEVDSQATVALMTASFGAFARNPSAGAARALGSAQRRLLTDPHFAHPSFWAAFTLLGDGGPGPGLKPPDRP